MELGSVTRGGRVSCLVHKEFTCQSAEVCVTYTPLQAVKIQTKTNINWSSYGSLIITKYSHIIVFNGSFVLFYEVIQFF